MIKGQTSELLDFSLHFRDSSGMEVGRLCLIILN